MDKEIKTKISHYYLNADGNFHGEYKWYYPNGQLWEHCHFKNGKYHGEYKQYDHDGVLYYHIYEVNDDEVHDFLEEDSEFIRVCLYMTHGAPFLGNTDAT